MLQIRHTALYILAFVFFLFAASSCRVLNPSEMFQAPKGYEYEGFEHEEKEYVIRPYDKLDIRVYTNNGITLIDMQNGESGNRSSDNVTPYLVDMNGDVKLPSVGNLKLEGLTIKEAELKLEEAYSEYYQKPYVLVQVTNRRVVVFTSGSTGGNVLNIENEKFTLVEALAEAGGIDDFSKAYSIKLIRGDLNSPQVYKYDISSLEDMQKANLVLQANDIIYVEKRPRYVARTLNEMMPYVIILNTMLLVYISVTSLQ